MSDVTFLTLEQIFDENKLEIFKKRGVVAPISDFAILLGGYVSNNCYYNNGDQLEDRTGWYWTKTEYSGGGAHVVASNGFRSSCIVTKRDGGSRPALPYSLISEISSNKVRETDGILEIKYGEYPQKAIPKSLAEEIDNVYIRRLLNKTGKTYTVDSHKYTDYDDGFEPQVLEEYEYKGKKYVRVQANSCFDGNEFLLSNGEYYKDGDYVWVEVLPIKWLVDEKNDIALSEKLLFAGVQFKNKNDYDGDFERTDIKRFMDNYFIKDILKSNVLASDSSFAESDKKRKSRIESMNPDKTTVDQRRKMTDTEIIHNWIESGHSVLLRGPSGIGKTERIKTLYPNLIYIKLTNNMFPEKVVGSMNLQTGQSIPPDFVKQALISCASEDERKLIETNVQNLYQLADTIYERSKNSSEKLVILLDELLNVKPAVQSLVYTLVLNKLVETGKGLKLPANTVVVATGNQKKYSSVAEDLAEPLEKRFDHILDMEPKVSEWVYEYAMPNKVHPSVIGYILSKYMETGQSEKIADMNYFYEEPEVGEKKLDKNGCRGRTNDPRGWVSVSKTLYAFEENLKAGKFVGKDVENILQISIGSKLREEWAKEFFDFYNIPTISVEEVMEEKYSQADLPRDINERFACLTSLLSANEEEFWTCRNFIKEHCDAEYAEFYEICWVGNDAKRMEKIMELQQLEMLDKGVGIRK